MAVTKNIYFKDDIAEKIKEVENLSELINGLLKSYFGDTRTEEQILKETSSKIGLVEIKRKRLEEFKINFFNNNPEATPEGYEKFISEMPETNKVRLGLI